MVMVLWVQLPWQGTRGETCIDPNQSRDDLSSALKASNLMIDGWIVYARKTNGTNQSVEVDIQNYNCTDISKQNRCSDVPHELKLHYNNSEHSGNNICGCTLRDEPLTEALAAKQHDERTFLLKATENKCFIKWETVAIPLNRPLMSVSDREYLELYGMDTLQFSFIHLPLVNAYTPLENAPRFHSPCRSNLSHCITTSLTQNFSDFRTSVYSGGL